MIYYGMKLDKLVSEDSEIVVVGFVGEGFGGVERLLEVEYWRE